jgi:hypothetical protein
VRVDQHRRQAQPEIVGRDPPEQRRQPVSKPGHRGEQVTRVTPDVGRSKPAHDLLASRDQAGGHWLAGARRPRSRTETGRRAAGKQLGEQLKDVTSSHRGPVSLQHVRSTVWTHQDRVAKQNLVARHALIGGQLLGEPAALRRGQVPLQAVERL